MGGFSDNCFGLNTGNRVAYGYTSAWRFQKVSDTYNKHARFDTIGLWGISSATGVNNVYQTVTLDGASSLLATALAASSIALTMF